MAKWKKKLRKIAKKAIPAIGLGLAATALARKRATDAPGDAYAKAKRLLTSDDAYAPKMPAHLTHTMGATGPRSQIGMGHPIVRGNIIKSAMYKSGGRVGVGKAKRGFGRALGRKK